MAERRDPERPAARSPLRPEEVADERGSSDEPILDLQRQAGNRAVADVLGSRSRGSSQPTPAVRLRDALRADRAPLQPELSLPVQRAVVGGKDESGKELRPYPGRLMRMGSRGQDVSLLQEMVGVDADGTFGPRTRAAVVAFQRSAGLAVDGIAGPNTWAALSAATETGKLAIGEVKLPPTEDKLGHVADTDKQAEWKLPPTEDKLGHVADTDKQAEWKLLEEEGKLP